MHVKSNKIFSYFSLADVKTIRMVNQQSNTLIAARHNKFSEIHSKLEKLNNLKRFLMNLELSQASLRSPSPWITELKQHCIEIKKHVPNNATYKYSHILTFIEELFYIVLTNEKLETPQVKQFVAQQLYNSIVAIVFSNNSQIFELYHTPIFSIMQIFKIEANPTTLSVIPRSLSYSSLDTMFMYGSYEMKQTNIKYNTYTKFALHHLKWMINARFKSPASLWARTVRYFWENIIDVEFIEDYLNQFALVIYTFDPTRCIELIICSVFTKDGKFNATSGKLELFLKHNSLLFDLETVIFEAIKNVHSDDKGILNLLHWIVEHKLDKKRNPSCISKQLSTVNQQLQFSHCLITLKVIRGAANLNQDDIDDLLQNFKQPKSKSNNRLPRPKMLFEESNVAGDDCKCCSVM